MKERIGIASAVIAVAVAITGAIFYKTKLCKRKFHKILR